jgi:hypothetical protein
MQRHETQYDVWSPKKGKAVHKVAVYGKTYTWTFTCIEDNVAWNNSAAKNLKALVDAAVPLESTLFVRPISAINVKIVAVDLLACNEAQTIRRFNVTVKPE